MNWSQDTIKDIAEKYGVAYYLLDLDQVRGNFLHIQNAFASRYERVGVAYSYKANYTPAIGAVINDVEGLIEVSSEMEYRIAESLGTEKSQIIVNGPAHTSLFVEEILLAGVMFNLDSEYHIRVLEDVLLKYPENEFHVGIRFNLSADEHSFSRFGMEASPSQMEGLATFFDRFENCHLRGVHCHLSTEERSAAVYGKRAKKLITLVKDYFSKETIEYINIGGGFFGELPEVLSEQFSEQLPTMNDYAEAITQEMNRAYPTGGPRLILEPGMSLIANCMLFVTTVVAVKEVQGESLVLLNASKHNVRPTGHQKKLAITSIGDHQDAIERCHLVGHTCMEVDYIQRDFDEPIGVGDFVVFENMGAYTLPFKPPFIEPCPPVVAMSAGRYFLAKRKETVEDVLRTYEPFKN